MKFQYWCTKPGYRTKGTNSASVALSAECAGWSVVDTTTETDPEVLEQGDEDMQEIFWSNGCLHSR